MCRGLCILDGSQYPGTASTSLGAYFLARQHAFGELSSLTPPRAGRSLRSGAWGWNKDGLGTHTVHLDQAQPGIGGRQCLEGTVWKLRSRMLQAQTKTAQGARPPGASGWQVRRRPCLAHHGTPMAGASTKRPRV